MNRVKDPFGDLFADKRTAQPMKKVIPSDIKDSSHQHKPASDILPKTIPVPRQLHVKDEALYQSMHGLDDLSAVEKQPVAAQNTFDVFGNFEDVALPEVVPEIEPGTSQASSEFSTPRTPERPPSAAPASSASWDDLRQLAHSLVDLDHTTREARLASMDKETCSKMLVVMQENWEDYGFARHTMALCTRFGVAPSDAFAMVCAQENSVIDATMSRATSSSSSLSSSGQARPATPAPPPASKLAPATPPPTFNLLDDEVPEGVLPPGFSPPPPRAAASNKASTAARPAAAAAPSPLIHVQTAAPAPSASTRVDFALPPKRPPPATPQTERSGSIGTPKQTSSLPAPKSASLADVEATHASAPLVDIGSPTRSGPPAMPSSASHAEDVDLLGDASLHSSVYASAHTHAKSVDLGMDLLGDSVPGDGGLEASLHAQGHTSHAGSNVDLLGDHVALDSGVQPGVHTQAAPLAVPHGADLLGDHHAGDDGGLDSFLAFVDSAAPSATATAKNSSYGDTSHGASTHARSARVPSGWSDNGEDSDDASGRGQTVQTRSRRGEAVDEESAELIAKMAHLPVNARLEDIALAIGLGDRGDFNGRIQKAWPMWEGMQKDKPGDADPPLRHQLWKTRVHKQIAKVLLSLVELEEKEKRIQEEADLGRAARPMIQKEIDTWARENMGIKRLPNLLATLHKGPLWEGAKWTPVNLSDVLEDKKLKLIFRKAILLTHTDKHADSPPDVKERAKMIFDYLIMAKDKMNAEKGQGFL